MKHPQPINKFSSLHRCCIEEKKPLSWTQNHQGQRAGVGTTSQTVIRGVVGQEITLPCTYNAEHGTNHMCWGRGSCPKSKCNNEILWTNGRTVTSRTSTRYQLKGLLSIGNVSLTIVNVKEGDSGMYCCRIEVPGWFNDLRKTLNLQVDRATTTTSRTTTKSYSVSTTTTSPPLTTTVTPETTPFLLTNPRPLTILTVAPLTANAPPIATSSVTTAIEFLTSDPPFVNISPSTTHLQIAYGHDYNFPTTASEMTTPAAVTTSPPATLLIPSNTENIGNWSTSAPAVAVPVANVSSTSTCSTAVLIASPQLVTSKPPMASPQPDFPEDGCSPATEAIASPTGIELLQKIFTHNRVAISCAVGVLVLLSVLLALLVKRKKIRKYLLNKTKSIKKLEEPEKVFLGMEGENGLFTL